MRFGCFVLLCFKIQYKMILSEIPRNIIWGKDNRMLNELYSRACYFYPRLSSWLPGPRSAAETETGPVLAGGAPGSQLQEEGGFPRATAQWHHFPHHPEALLGWHGDTRGDVPSRSRGNGSHLLGRLLINIHSRKEAISGAWKPVYKRLS